MRLSCVKSDIHHRFAYGDGRAFGVRACIASNTANISASVYYYTIPLKGLAPNVLVILALMSFYSAFLSSNRSYTFSVKTETLNAVSIAR
jgi:hypothetical protein